MENQKVMLGNEAIARGAYEAGVWKALKELDIEYQ